MGTHIDENKKRSKSNSFSPLQVDDEIRQKGSTKDMIFKIPYLISHISSIMTLFEGDVILTGTRYAIFHFTPMP